MDRLQAIEIFVKVAELKSFSAAATALDLSRTLVSERVRDLEEEFPAGLDDFPPPLTVPGEGSDDWLTDGLLPPKDWKAEERDFVRSKGGK